MQDLCVLVTRRSTLLGYTPPVNEQDRPEVNIEIDQPVTDPDLELASTEPLEDETPANPDAWLQWALIIGLLALFLICALILLIGWNNR